MTTSLTDFAAGHEFPPLPLNLPAERSRAYREATGDALPLYDEAGVLPPLAVAAFVLGAMLEQVGLPPGSLHVSESLIFHAPVPAGSAVVCRAKLAQRSQRSGWIISVLETEIFRDEALAISARASVMSPAVAG